MPASIWRTGSGFPTHAEADASLHAERSCLESTTSELEWLKHLMQTQMLRNDFGGLVFNLNHFGIPQAVACGRF